MLELEPANQVIAVGQPMEESPGSVKLGWQLIAATREREESATEIYRLSNEVRVQR